MNIREFLLERITEDESDAQADAAEMSSSSISIQFDCATQARFTPARVLAECAAKRAIIAGIIPERDPQAGDPDYDPLWVIRELAAVYKNHPDYQQEWAIGQHP